MAPNADIRRVVTTVDKSDKAVVLFDGSDLRPLVVPAVGDEAARVISNHCVGIAVDLDRRLLYWTQKGAPNGGEGGPSSAALARGRETHPGRRSPAGRTRPGY